MVRERLRSALSVAVLLVTSGLLPAAVAADRTPQSGDADPTAAARDVQALLAKVEHRYRGMSSFRLPFTQSYTSATFGTRDEARGTVYVVPPSKMLWVYDVPKGQRGALDGTKYWFIDPEDKEVKVRERSGAPDPLAELLAGRVELGKVFAVRRSREPAEPGGVTLDLVPRESREDMEHAVIEADEKDGTLRRLEIVDPLGNRFQYRFGAPSPAPPPPADQFKLVVPPGYTRTSD